MANIGRVRVRELDKPALVSQNFSPKLNLNIGEVNDVDTIGLQDGHTLIFNSSVSKFEAKPAKDLTGQITEITGGTF
jgi:hypothetical protein